MTKLTALCFLFAPALIAHHALADTQAVSPSAPSTERIQSVEDFVGVEGWPDVVAAPSPAGNKGLDYVEPESAKAKRAEANATLEAEVNASPFMDAFKASFGGFSRDLFILATQQEASQYADPEYDVSVNRRAFREVYPQEYWEELERSKNQAQEDALIAKLDAKAERERAMGLSPAGTAMGFLFDPLIIGLLFLLYKASFRRPFALGLSRTSAPTSS